MKRLMRLLVMGLLISYGAGAEDNATHGVPPLNVTPRPDLSDVPEDMDDEVNWFEIMEILKDKGILKFAVITDESDCYEVGIQWNPKYSFMTYMCDVFSNDASNITIYLPFPHYKGKPDKKVLDWLKKNIAYETQRHYNEEFKQIASNVKLDLIETDYGKMVSLYIPKLSSKIEPNICFRIGYGGIFGQEIEVDKKKIIYDYKLSPEASGKMKPIRKATQTTTIEEDYTMPFYVSFEGGSITVKPIFLINIPSEDEFVSILNYTIPTLEIDRAKSGWHWLTVRKQTMDLKKTEKATKKELQKIKTQE